MERRTDNQYGLTLIELIMAITIISFLATMFASLFGMAIKAYDVMENRNELIFEGESTLREIAKSIRLARWVEGALPLSGATEITIMCDIDEDDVLERVRYYGKAETRELRRQIDGAPTEGVVLAQDVKEVSFSREPELVTVSLRLSGNGETIALQTSAGGEWW